MSRDGGLTVKPLAHWLTAFQSQVVSQLADHRLYSFLTNSMTTIYKINLNSVFNVWKQKLIVLMRSVIHFVSCIVFLNRFGTLTEQKSFSLLLMQFSKHRNRNHIGLFQCFIHTAIIISLVYSECSDKEKASESSSSLGVSASVMSVVRGEWPDCFQLIGRQKYAEVLSAKNTKLGLHFEWFTIIGQQKIRNMVYSSSLDLSPVEHLWDVVEGEIWMSG